MNLSSRHLMGETVSIKLNLISAHLVAGRQLMSPTSDDRRPFSPLHHTSDVAGAFSSPSNEILASAAVILETKINNIRHSGSHKAHTHLSSPWQRRSCKAYGSERGPVKGGAVTVGDHPIHGNFYSMSICKTHGNIELS